MKHTTASERRLLEKVERAIQFGTWLTSHDEDTVRQMYEDYSKGKRRALSLSGDGSALPDGWMDWNTLSLYQMVEHLRKKFMFSSSGDAKCILHLIEFYDKHR